MHHNLIIKDGDTTKVAKEVLVDGIQFVDEKPRAGSTNPVTSGGVANAVTNVLDDHAAVAQDEELTIPAAEAANYTVGNYFEQDGEIWKCTDKTDNGDGTWTVEAEKVNGVVPVLNELVSASGGYKLVNITLDAAATKTIPVGQKEDIYVECRAKASDQLIIQIAENCTDAVLNLKRINATPFADVTVKRGNTTIYCFGESIITGVESSDLDFDYRDRFLLTTNYEEGDHGATYPSTPTDFSEVELNEENIVAGVSSTNVYGEFRGGLSSSWLFVVKGRNVMVLPS